jgi:hypothetical protein
MAVTYVWVQVRLFPWKVIETTTICPVVTSDKNSAVCLFNKGLFIETAGTEGMVLGDELCCLERSVLWYFRQRRMVIP